MVWEDDVPKSIGSESETSWNKFDFCYELSIGINFGLMATAFGGKKTASGKKKKTTLCSLQYSGTVLSDFEVHSSWCYLTYRTEIYLTYIGEIK